MKHVTFKGDMKPYRAGDKRLVPDDVAARLEADGFIEPDPPSFPAESAPKAMAPQRSRRARALLGQTYLTK